MPRKLWVAGWYDPTEGEWTHVTFARKSDAHERAWREHRRIREAGDIHPAIEVESYTPDTLPWWAPRPVLSPGVLYADQAKQPDDPPEYAVAIDRMLDLGFLTPGFLTLMQTHESGQTCDLKLEGPWRRVWLSRMTPDDGETHQVYVERWNDRIQRWESTGYFPFTGDTSDA